MLQARSPSSVLKLEVETRRGLSMSVVEVWLTLERSCTYYKIFEMSRNYALDANKPAFAVADDDMESAFLHSSGGPYMASDRLFGSGPKPFNSEPVGVPPEQQEYQSTVQQIKDVERRTLQSTKRSLQAIAESEQVGVETAKDLVHQREQLENTNKRLDTINEDLKESQKNINAIKSVFSSFKQWMLTPKNADAKDKKKDSGVTSPSSETEYKEPSFDHNPKLERAVNIAPKFQDPSLRLRGIDYSESSGSSKRYEGPELDDEADWKQTTKRVNKQLDTDLEEMAFGLSRLKGLAEGLGQEITEQNQLLDSITTKADKTDLNLNSTNKQINTILKK
ncbi:Target SNARE coiled-coil domain [Trinorchestia longiramus]|nr:Target SNARE coiled-coil domain [Trinorchestia longiramus]